MSFEISRTYGFEAAHLLPNTPADHKCRRLHGHSFKVEIRVAGELVEPEGWVYDFAMIDEAWAPLHEALDHQYLNEIDGLENPTSEKIAAWIWWRIEESLPGLAAVSVAETCTSECVFRGP
jgi:6-pyruvoyltetrahydropterin/6-carboxytetrahydropterin synthase